MYRLFCFACFIRLHERLQECNGDEVLKAEAGAKVQKFTEWALKCIGFHSRCQGNRDRVSHNSAIEIQLQLSAFKTFLDLAGNHLTGKDFTEAFDAACFPLTLFSSSFDPGWASGISATAIQGLLGMLVEGGADNVNQCFLEASRFGSTELVRILLQVEVFTFQDDNSICLSFFFVYFSWERKKSFYFYLDRILQVYFRGQEIWLGYCLISMSSPLQLSITRWC